MIHKSLKELVGPIDELRLYDGNPRQGDVGAIVVSLERNGQYKPIVVNRRKGVKTYMHVLAGNHTLLAAKQLGWTEIARTFVSVDDDTARRIMLVDNRTNDLATMDEGALAQLLKDIAGSEGAEGLFGTGYDADDLDDLLAKMNADEVPPPKDKEQFGVIVVCTSEEHQQQVSEQLTELGHECRVVNT